MIGSLELIVILIAVLFIFGPDKVPELARMCGKAVGDFKKAQRSVELGLADFDLAKKKDDTSIIYAKIKNMAEFRGFDTSNKTTEQLIDLLAGSPADIERINNDDADNIGVTAGNNEQIDT